MKINLTKLLDIEIRVIRLNKSPETSFTGNLEENETSKEDCYSFELEDA
jgi:hypothetical protein